MMKLNAMEMAVDDDGEKDNGVSGCLLLARPEQAPGQGVDTGGEKEKEWMDGWMGRDAHRQPRWSGARRRPQAAARVVFPGGQE